jgi:hypothetical protein
LFDKRAAQRQQHLRDASICVAPLQSTLTSFG